METSPPEARRWPRPRPGFLSELSASVGVVVLAIATLGLIWAAHRILLVVFLGALGAILLDGIAGLVARVLPIDRWWAARLVVVALFGLILTGLALFGGTLASQFYELFDRLPQALASARDELAAQPWGAAFAERIPDLDALMEGVDVRRITGAFSSLMGGLAAGFVVLFIGVYAGMSPNRYVDNAARLIPPRARERGLQVLHSVHRALQLWLLGRLTAMLLVSILTSVGLTLIGIPYAIPLGISAGLLEFIPYVGLVLAVLPAVLVAAGTDQAHAPLYVLLLYGGIQFVESYFITPLIEQKAVEVPPALGLSVQAILGVLAGAIGVIVATPLTVAVIVLIQTLYLQGAIHEDVAVIGAGDDD